jgi:glycosyltransferase involved in cell wall biosynthesis
VRSLLLINATLNQDAEAAGEAGSAPRKDYDALRQALGSDVIDLTALGEKRWLRLARRIIGPSGAQALQAWSSAAHYDVIFADRETTGFVLAALFRFRRRRPRLVIIGHLLSPAKKRLFCRVMGLQHVIDCLVVHSSLQKHIARTALGFRSNQVALLPYQTDDQFWKTAHTPIRNQICSVGLEYRDYATLIDAVAGLDVDVVIAAASNWSKHRTVPHTHLPPNVRLVSYGYESLRQLYDESLFVVVPLVDVENQAGITSILEAMAMGKVVVVSHARGQTDVVRDRRCRNRVDRTRQTQSSWLRDLGVDEQVAHAPTGMYVPPGAPGQLRQTISFLVSHPEVAREMGMAGRQVIEASMTLEHFVNRLVVILQGGAGVPLSTTTQSLASG